MSRRRVAEKREVLPDPKFGSEVLTKFINMVMVDGKKSIAEKIVYGALAHMESKGIAGADGKLTEVLDQVAPRVEVKSRRVGGATYQVPVEVRPARQTTLAMRWLIDAARKRGESTMAIRLGAEMADALDGRGSACKKREDTHRMAEANKAFSHFRW